MYFDDVDDNDTRGCCTTVSFRISTHSYVTPYGYAGVQHWGYHYDSYCPRPSREELLKRWWRYLARILSPAVLTTLEPVPPQVKRCRVFRLCHERQYPRIVRCRNNRLP